MKFLARSNFSALPEPVHRTHRRFISIGLSLIAMACTTAIMAQETAPSAVPPTQSTAVPAAATAPAQQPTAESKSSKKEAAEVTTEELKEQLVGKQLFLRGGFLGDSISFNEHGIPIGHPAAGSYTLSAVEIEKVRLTKHKVELEGARYALHFLGALPYEDPSKAVDRIKVTPKKKVLKITIDREQVIKEKRAKESKSDKKAASAGTPGPAGTGAPASSESDSAPLATHAAAPQKAESLPAEAPEPAAEQAADPASVTTTFSPGHAAMLLREALERIFAQGLDEKVRADMPPFWQLYYKAQDAGVDYRPSDPNVMRSSAVDTQAKLTTSIAPESNEYAQASGIAGPALYRVVIGADGKPAEIAVERPIGFGLDENAVAAIRKATFQPAVKGGQPVAETLDIAVLFRIYSKRTSVAGAASTDKPIEVSKPVLPGPYTIRAPQSTPAPDAAPPPAGTPAPDGTSTTTPAPTTPAPTTPDPNAPPK